MNRLISMEEMTVFLKDHGIKPSLQRIKIFEYLANTKEHPKVETIHSNLIGEIPTLSKTTVYNTLHLFIDKGIVKMLTIDESESRYDADISMHGHFICGHCQAVYDFNVNAEVLHADGIEGFEIQQQDIYYRGICKECKIKKMEE